MNFVVPLLAITLLVAEGYLLTRILTREKSVTMLLALSLPVAVLLNTFVFFGFTLLHIPLSPLALLLAHIVLCGALSAWMYFRKSTTQVFELKNPEPMTTGKQILIICCLLLLSGRGIYGFAHAVLLPTAQLDSLANWNMRSKLSFMDGAIAFDADASRGMEKPHYPFLFHSSQIIVNQGQTEWSDALGNGIHFFLAASSFLALFLILRRLSGVTPALLAVTVMTGLPLASAHLGQGYADLMLAQFAVLSLACLLLCVRERGGWLLMSALFASAAVWTKEEGLSFVLLPWLGLLILFFWLQKGLRKNIIQAVCTAVVAGGSFPMFALLHGFGLTPHGNDTALSFNAEAFSGVPEALFLTSSLGPVWYVLPIALIATVCMGMKEHVKVDRLELLSLLWGGMVTLLVFYIYLLTPNAAALLNGTAFYRQMFTPIGLIIVSIVVTVVSRPEKRL